MEGVATTTDGASICYWETGEGHPLLLVSGLGGLASFWDMQKGPLSSRYRVITYDHRGAGKSSRSQISYSVQQMTSDALSVLNATGVDKAIVIGHSTGGCIGLSLALDHQRRVRTLISSSSWAEPDPYFKTLFEFRRYVLNIDLAAYVRSGSILQYPPAWISANKSEVEAIEARLLGDGLDARVIASKIDAILAFDRISELDAIRCPTLVTAASDDVICPSYLSSRMSSQIAGSAFALLEGGHFCPRTNPAQFNAAVSSFLNAVTADE